VCNAASQGRDRLEGVKKRAETRWAGGTACPTNENSALALVAQAVSPATCDFFPASRESGCRWQP